MDIVRFLNGCCSFKHKEGLYKIQSKIDPGDDGQQLCKQLTCL